MDVETDRAEPALPTQRAVPETVPAAPGDPLAAEMRHSALLLGWTLGLMGAFAVLLLLVTTRFGG